MKREAIVKTVMKIWKFMLGIGQRVLLDDVASFRFEFFTALLGLGIAIFVDYGIARLQFVDDLGIAVVGIGIAVEGW